MAACFGGRLLALMDTCSAMAAMRHSRRNCVTVSIDKVDFVAPVRHGFLLDLTARVHLTARTSMEIYVSAFAENPLTGDRKLVCEAFFSFVALDGDDTPAARSRQWNWKQKPIRNSIPTQKPATMRASRAKSVRAPRFERSNHYQRQACPALISTR